MGLVTSAVACISAILLVVLLHRVLMAIQRRRGYAPIDQDTHGLYSQALINAKDSWESMPRHASP